jgi:hypothetical protein
MLQPSITVFRWLTRKEVRPTMHPMPPAHQWRMFR